jgi:hypothetical protein
MYLKHYHFAQTSIVKKPSRIRINHTNKIEKTNRLKPIFIPSFNNYNPLVISNNLSHLAKAIPALYLLCFSILDSPLSQSI